MQETAILLSPIYTRKSHWPVYGDFGVDLALEMMASKNTATVTRTH
ncbi:MAG: hypothetical protein MIO93_05430 [ANME-2 cluster archaeon]|nr:hypothetical protein [ANME-2 cluster archaeon]